MTVTVRMTGILATLTGVSRLVLTLEQGATVATVVARLNDQFPDLAPRLERAVFAAGGRVVSGHEPLSDGDEVAFLIPVAGGCAAIAWTVS